MWLVDLEPGRSKSLGRQDLRATGIPGVSPAVKILLQ